LWEETDGEKRKVTLTCLDSIEYELANHYTIATEELAGTVDISVAILDHLIPTYPTSGLKYPIDKDGEEKSSLLGSICRKPTVLQNGEFELVLGAVFRLYVPAADRGDLLVNGIVLAWFRIAELL